MLRQERRQQVRVAGGDEGMPARQGLLRERREVFAQGCLRSMEATTMNDRPDKGERKHPKQESRQDRLRLALRENLKRRKSQARGRSETTRPDEESDQDRNK